MKPLTLSDDFGFTSDHDLLRKTAGRLLADKCGIDALRVLATDERGYDPALYAEMADLGWVGLGLGDDVGGAGLDHLSLALLFEQTGRYLLPSPLLGSVLAATAIELAGSDEQKRALCTGIADGTIIATIALTEPGGSWDPSSTAATAVSSDGGYTLSGTKTHVMWGASAAAVVAPFSVDGALSLFAVPLPTDGVRVEPEVSVDGTRRTARLVFDGARVDASARLAGDGAAALATLYVRGYVILAAEMIGAAEAMLGRTREYAVERKQFNRQIGSFQAVKHPIVDVMVAIERARSLMIGAAAALDEAPDRAENTARMAKAAATDALRFAVDRGVQLHGGYGFTWDCDAHFFFKRYLWSAATLGDATHHRKHLANALIG